MHLASTITLVAGWHSSLTAARNAAMASADCWTGTAQEFWEANADGYTYGEIRDLLRAIEARDVAHLGGGSQPCFSLIADAPAPRIKIRIDHDREGEFCVRHPENQRADSFTEDRQDAIGTACAIAWTDCAAGAVQIAFRRVPVCLDRVKGR